MAKCYVACRGISATSPKSFKKCQLTRKFWALKKKNDKFIFQKANGMIVFFYTKVTFIILILKRENVTVKIESIIKMFLLTIIW